MCRKELNEWEPDDDPFELHYQKCNQTCAWAVARCGPELDKGQDGQYHFANSSRLPTSKAMEKARLETFMTKKPWPHDAVKGHGASSKKMAKAGFIYAPGHSGDDSATCVYCELALNGWDKDDDPTEEHVKRMIKTGKQCPFLSTTTSKPASSKPPSRAAQSKPSSYSTHPSSEDELAGAIASAYNSNSSRSMRSSVNRPSTAASTAKTPASGSRRSTRGTGSRTTPLAGSEVDDTDGASGSDAGKRVSKTKGKRKGTAASSKAKDRMQVVEEEVEPEVHDDGLDEDVVEVEPPPKPKRGPGRPPKHKKPESAVEETEVEPEPANAPAKKGLARTRSKAALVSDSDAPQPQASGSKSGSRRKTAAKAQEVHIAETEDEQIEEVPVAKPGRKRVKKGEESEPPSDVPAPARGKGAKGRTVSRSKAKHVPPPETDSDIEILPVEPRRASVRSANAREAAGSSKGKGSAKRQIVSSASDDAGYATAEPPSKPRLSRGGPPKAADEGHGSQSRKRVPSPAPKDDSDVEMTEHAPPAPKVEAERKDWRSPQHSTSSDVGGQIVLKKLSRVSAKPKVSQTARSSTSTTNGSRHMIVEISDDEDDEGKNSQPGVSVPKRHSQTSALVDAPSSKGRGQEHIEVMPPRSSQSSAQSRSSGLVTGKQMQTDAGVPSKPGSGSRGSVSGMGSTSGPVARADGADGGLAAVINGKHIAESSASTPPSSGGSDEEFPFAPSLSMISLHRLASLTDEEGSMTLEQYISNEIEMGRRLLKEDAEMQIAAIKEKAAEMRKAIEAL
ncbi:uncharacterized protein B0H18DRAFT_1211938 [Fomitopsis serialis]|uniref:uncharacterized protein n=1 Tax=Fomitopsis serialis TaxID=139415 RepID=UPI0020086DA1|nr:uncharacterized protein B0H18DRAFT_1211938 [Neoantrodia serialis]KAH9924174.1 hypothetical protein B0H18DRAFT_1211938 [Neoantrodia serialis]